MKAVAAELAELRSVASSFSLDHIRDGTWFNQFVYSMLGQYHEKVIARGGAAYYREQFAGYGDDAIVDKLVQDAVRFATVAGGASGVTASAAVVLAIGSGGAALPAAGAGVTVVMAEVLYTVRLQLRLVYDMAHLYGVPLDPENLEDLYRAFSLAMGVKGASAGGLAVKSAAPEVARAHLRALVHGHTAAIQQVAVRLLGPRIGRQITQRAILRSAVPVVSAVASGGWNYVTTRAIAGVARHRLRVRGRVRAAAVELGRALARHPEHAGTVLHAVWALSLADRELDAAEEELFSAIRRELAVEPGALRELERVLSTDAAALPPDLAALPEGELRDALAACLETICAVDGEIAEDELRLLELLLGQLGRPWEPQRLRELAGWFAPPPGLVAELRELSSKVAADARRLASAAAASGGPAVRKAAEGVAAASSAAAAQVSQLLRLRREKPEAAARRDQLLRTTEDDHAGPD